MNKTSIITPTDYKDFFAVCLMGNLEDPLRACLKRAYRDFCRTLPGIADAKSQDEQLSQARNVLQSQFQSLCKPPFITNIADFDEWHRQVCQELCIIHNRADYRKFFTGHAQKWVNMTFKYIFALGEEYLPGYLSLYSFCHVPIDNIVILRLSPFGFPHLKSPWSQIRDYDEYMKLQNWIRQKSTLIPLDLEFIAWLNPDKNLSQYLK
jgi:hypothetical protein